MTSDLSFPDMATTAPAGPDAAAASPLLPWNAKVQKFIKAYSVLQLWDSAVYICSARFWSGESWRVPVDMLRVWHMHAGGVGVGIIRAPAQGEVLGTVTAGLGAVHTALQMLRSYLSLESHAKVPSSAIGSPHHSHGTWFSPASSSYQLGHTSALSLLILGVA